LVKRLGILGSTGSIGTQALEVIRHLNEIDTENKIEIVCLSAGRNIGLLEKQAREFNVRNLCVANKTDVLELEHRLKDMGPLIVYGQEGLEQLAAMELDMLLMAVVGNVGLTPAITAIRKGTAIALANKETLVTGGEIVMKEAKKYNVSIIPVDSEHSAIFQCLHGYNREHVEKLILTASGGPFRKLSGKQLEKVSVKSALAHPTWKMGGKITVDCATLMNKGLEVIEAKWLFNMALENIEVVVHPESIIHSMVLYRDGVVMAQMGVPDMKVPIQYALTYPERKYSPTDRLDLVKIGSLNFEGPDPGRFPCLRLALEAAKIGGTMPAVMNAADELAVEKFINAKISFTDIPCIIERMMNAHAPVFLPSLEDILEADRWTRERVNGDFA
jgi:1-deoxy-D-xylulose-5-phosphate reductoisomerase